MALFERTFKAHCDWKERWYPGEMVRQAAPALERQHIFVCLFVCLVCGLSSTYPHVQRLMLFGFRGRLAECQCVRGCLRSVVNSDRLWIKITQRGCQGLSTRTTTPGVGSVAIFFQSDGCDVSYE